MARKKLNQKQTTDFFEKSDRLRQRRMDRDSLLRTIERFYAKFGEEMPAQPLGPVKRLSPKRVR